MGPRLVQHFSPLWPPRKQTGNPSACSWTGYSHVHRHAVQSLTQDQPASQAPPPSSSTPTSTQPTRVLWASHSVIRPPWSLLWVQTASPSESIAVAGTIGLAGRGQGNDKHLESTPHPPTVTAAGGRNPQHPAPRAYSKVKDSRLSFLGLGHSLPL